MAELVGVFATSHTPVMINFPHAIADADREQIYGAFKTLGAQIAATRPQVLVVISDDHLHNFFLDNFPAFCIGATNRYPTPVEHWLKAERRELRGDVELGAYLLRQALDADFDPSFSMDLTLDHGVLTPLELSGLSQQIAIVPILVNCVQPPMPTMRRCLQWGQFLGRALRAYPGCERVAVLATGGISHDVGTPRMGMVNEPFDREFLRLLAADDDEGLVEHSTRHVGEAGNGTEEIRNWLIAHGAAAGARHESIYYKPMPDWYTGIALGYWAVAS